MSGYVALDVNVGNGAGARLPDVPGDGEPVTRVESNRRPKGIGNELDRGGASEASKVTRMMRSSGILCLLAFIGGGIALAVLAAAVAASGSEEAGGVDGDANEATRRRLQDTATAGDPGALCLTAARGELCHRLVTWAMEDGVRLHPSRYPGLSSNSSFEEFQSALHRSSPEFCPPPCACHTAVEGEECHGLVVRAMAFQIRKQPERFPGLSAYSSSEEFQAALHSENSSACPRPCTPQRSKATAGSSCDYGHLDPSPAHSACLIAREGKLLAVKNSSGAGFFDLPGGSSNWHAPGRCTAHTKTLEKTGYLAAPREMLGVTQAQFRVFRCELLRADPVGSHDSEASWVGWLTADEVRSGQWRHPQEAARYAGWIK